MKYLIGTMMAVLIIISLSYQFNRHYTEFDRRNILYEGDEVAVPEYLRETIGRDSIQLIFIRNQWEANFTYPNQWSKINGYSPTQKTITHP